MDIVGTARRLADEVLFPAALATDTADTVPVDLLDAIAHAGLYGLSGPASAGGLDADFPTVCAVVETLASGCLTTTFVWVQHIGAVLTATTSENDAIAEWVDPLCRGERRAGLALGGAIPGPPLLRATANADGWTFSGAAGELALRASAALSIATGSRSLLLSDHAQRLAREALFGLVYALRPGSREALLAQLGAARRASSPRRDGP